MSKISQQILEYLQTIPERKVSTYKNIAEKFGVHPRVVASAMRHNKHPDIYPCYKVVAHSRKISGYTTPGGVLEKIQKLEADGIVIEDGKVGEEFII